MNYNTMKSSHTHYENTSFLYLEYVTNSTLAMKMLNNFEGNFLFCISVCLLTHAITCSWLELVRFDISVTLK